LRDFFTCIIILITSDNNTLAAETAKDVISCDSMLAIPPGGKVIQVNRMFKRFYPDYDVKSAYVIDYEELYGKGYRGIIFDIDNTLVPHGEPADERAIQLITRLKQTGFGVMLLSNNKELRVKQFNDKVSVRYIFKAGKPGRRGYERAMSELGTTAENTLFIGDQLFTDVWGAKRAGIVSYLVEPIHPKEEIQIVLKRYLERIVLYFYRRNKKYGGK